MFTEKQTAVKINGLVLWADGLEMKVHTLRMLKVAMPISFGFLYGQFYPHFLYGQFMNCPYVRRLMVHFFAH